MHRRICQIKASEKTEVKYMQSWEEKILIKQEYIIDEHKYEELIVEILYAKKG